MLESAIQKKVVKWLLSIGCKVIVLKVASKSGNADLVICYRGYYIEFEMKQEGKEATKLQVLKGRECVNADGQWFTIHSLEEAQEAIEFVEKIYAIKRES